MQFLKMFFLREGDNVRLLSYKAFSIGALIKEDRFEEYVEKHINFFAAPILRKKKLRKSELPAQPCIIEVYGKVHDMREHKLNNPWIEVSLVESLSEAQRELAGLPRIARREFLEEIGMKPEDFSNNWGRLDDRQPEWQKDQKKYGFDERATWCLDTEIKQFIYERLVFYQRYAPKESDDDCPKFVFKKKKYSFEQYLEKIIEGLKLDLITAGFTPLRKEKEAKAKIENALPMLVKYIDYFWW